jgi:hypothetical protein
VPQRLGAANRNQPPTQLSEKGQECHKEIFRQDQNQ